MGIRYLLIPSILALSCALFFPAALPYQGLPAATLNWPNAASSEWINLGKWYSAGSKTHKEKDKDNNNMYSSQLDTATKSYSEAGEDLAITLYDYASIAPTDVVLDVCMGNGDSLMLLHRKYGVTKIFGENLSYKEVERARTRIDDYLSSSVADDESAAAANSITISHKSATDAGIYDTNPSFLVNKITALDCAYHFDTRESFLLRAARILSSSSSTTKTTRTLALADVILKYQPTAPAAGAVSTTITSYVSSFLQNFALRSCCFLAGIPYANAVSARQYILAMENAGFTNVTLQEIVPSVFAGFSEFLPKHLERISNENVKNVDYQEQVNVSFFDRSFLIAAAHFMKFADRHVSFVLVRGNMR
jgi:hypothetical protein